MSSQKTIDTMLTIGCGNVTLSRVRPAQLQLHEEGVLRRAAYLDILPRCPFDFEKDNPKDFGSDYIPIDSDGILPLEKLAQQGYLGPHVLALVCPPTRFHVLYAKQLLGTGCRIAVEKPLTQDRVAAESLLFFDEVVFPIGHQLFKDEMLKFLLQVKEGEEL